MVSPTASAASWKDLVMLSRIFLWAGIDLSLGAALSSLSTSKNSCSDDRIRRCWIFIWSAVRSGLYCADGVDGFEGAEFDSEGHSLDWRLRGVAVAEAVILSVVVASLSTISDCLAATSCMLRIVDACCVDVASMNSFDLAKTSLILLSDSYSLAVIFFPMDDV